MIVPQIRLGVDFTCPLEAARPFEACGTLYLLGNLFDRDSNGGMIAIGRDVERTYYM